MKYIPTEDKQLDCSTVSAIDAEAYFHMQKGDYKEAEKLYRRNHEYCSTLFDAWYLDLDADTCTSLAEAFYHQEDYDQGILYARKAITSLDIIRTTLSSDEYRQQVGGQLLRNAFSNIIQNTLKKNDDEAVFDLAEEYKARALLDLMGSKTEKQHGTQRMLVAKNEPIPSPALQQEPVDDAKQDPVNITRDLHVEQTPFSRLPEDTSMASRMIKCYKEVQTLKTDNLAPLMENMTFISYAIGEESSVVVVLSKEGAHAVPLEKVGEKDLRKDIDAFRQALGIRETQQRDLDVEPQAAVPEEEKQKALEESSAHLYSLLVEPVLPFIKTSLVYFSPDSVLNYLPFEALGKNGQCLIDKYTIAYAPSATVLKYCMDKERHNRESILAFGNPNLQNPAFRLTNAKREVEALKGLFPRVDSYTDDNATEGIMRQHGAEYDILHFACHSELNLDDPMLTSLRLAPDSENDGYLHAGEIFDYDLNVSLVVLSACNTALGQINTGNELAGLTRAFLYAGTPAIVASLWTVDDRSTAFLMETFYRNLTTMDKAEALRQAKIATKEKYPHPFYWAAFCLQGDYR